MSGSLRVASDRHTRPWCSVAGATGSRSREGPSVLPASALIMLRASDGPNVIATKAELVASKTELVDRRSCLGWCARSCFRAEISRRGGLGHLV